MRQVFVIVVVVRETDENVPVDRLVKTSFMLIWLRCWGLANVFPKLSQRTIRHW